MLGIMAQTLLQAVMAYQVYDISDSVLNLGILGLARFLPSLGMSLIGGAAADTYNRRTIIVIAQCVPLTCGVTLAAASFGGWVQVELIFALVLMMGLSAAFEGPARLSLLPALVRPETFTNAVTVSSTLQTLGMTTGPVLGTNVQSVLGYGPAYTVQVVLVAGAMFMMLLLRYQHQRRQGNSVSFAAIKEGVLFVRKSQVLLGAMSLDMFAVIFGGAQALLPVYSRDILGVGEVGYGILYSSLEVGAFLMSLVLVLRPPIQQAGKALVYSVMAYGLFTLAFGLSREFALSVVLYMAIGAADQISVVMRSTTIQLATPDALRGRVSAVSQVFIGASNQLGAVESGFLAAATSATFAVVSGGAAAFGIASFVGWRLKGLYNYQIPRAPPLATYERAHGPPTTPVASAQTAEEPASGSG
jgi:Transmembrane secretion effector